MTRPLSSFALAGLTIALGFLPASPFAAGSQEAAAPLMLNSSRITIAGTSNIHEYHAATAAARLTRVVLSSAQPATIWDDAIAPGALEAFELTVPVTSLLSGNNGLDKNMHKALKATAHPTIAFRVSRLAPAAPGAVKATGVLTIAGTEREVNLDLTTQRAGDTLVVKGAVELLMTDYGVTPPKAMLGVLKTNPKVTVTFETVLASPRT